VVYAGRKLVKKKAHATRNDIFSFTRYFFKISNMITEERDATRIEGRFKKNDSIIQAIFPFRYPNIFMIRKAITC